MEKCEWKVGDYEEVQGLKMWLVTMKSVFKKFGCRVRGGESDDRSRSCVPERVI